MEVREVDPADEALVHRWWELANEVDHVDRPWSWFMARETAVATFRTPSTIWDRRLLGAFEDDAMVAGAHVQLPLRDNTHVGNVWVFAPPGVRRRGLGSALLGAALARVRECGRDTVFAQVMVPRGCDAPGLAFAKRHGFVPGLTEVTRIADLAATEADWSALASEAAGHHAGYRLVTYHDVVPDELVEGYCALNESFNDEAPTGDLDVEREVYDVARVREKERVFRATNRSEVGTVAVAPDGTLVGYTELVVSGDSPDRAVQGGTLVRPGHRGRRLGLAMKVANQQALRARFPSARRVITGNADGNVHMNAVNDRLGFREVEDCVELQRKVGSG